MYEQRMRVVPETHGGHLYPDEAHTGDCWSREFHLCGQCGIILVRHVCTELLRGRIIQCPNCGAYNTPAQGSQSGADESGQLIRPVVVIDDEPDVLHLICDILEGEGFDVLCLDHPRAAEALDDAVRPRMFLVDIMLPGTNGIDLAKHLRTARYIDTPIVAMSASDSMLRAASASSLFNATLPKPCDLFDLLGTVAHYAA